MLTRNSIIEEAQKLGFEDVGFTTAEPFVAQLEYLRNHQEEYGWTEKVGLGLMAGTDPKAVMPSAKSIIVLLEGYFREAFPSALEGHFGRCYLDDDRVTKDGTGAAHQGIPQLSPEQRDRLQGAFQSSPPRGCDAGRHGDSRQECPALFRQGCAQELLGASPHRGCGPRICPRFSRRWPGLPGMVQKRLRCRLSHKGASRETGRSIRASAFPS